MKGQSDIDLVVSNPTRCIVIHTSNMDITNIFIDDIHSNARQRASTGGTIALFDQRYDQTTEQLTLEFESDIPQGHAALHLSFSYLLRDGMSGFYKSGYALRDGTREVVAATQFEANSARTAFPCFDEPAMKAVFAVEVITEKGLMVLSNMPAAAAHHVCCIVLYLIAHTHTRTRINTHTLHLHLHFDFHSYTLTHIHAA